LMDRDAIKKTFKNRFGREPRMFRSPGRINIIGEHTDYNEGFVLPAAIDKEIVAAIAPNDTDGLCRLLAYDLSEAFEFELSDMEPDEMGWPNYLMGVVDQFMKNGYDVEGFDCVIGGNVPLGAGLSSSAALESVIAFALNELYDLGIEKIDLIKMAQLAEHTFAGVKCGIMDQFASVMGSKDHVFRLDCKTLEHEYYPLEMGDYQILLINSNVKHALASTEYNTRRQECEEGVGILQRYFPEIHSLRDVSLKMLKRHQQDFPEVVYRRCRFVVEENQRVLDSCDALQSGDLVKLGQLVYGSHKGLSADYEVSCRELDFLVEQTRNKEYILGARMMGGGFGGCTINIIRGDKIPEFLEGLAPLYEAEFGKQMTPIKVSIEEGSSEIT
jgi:galactokinase